MKKTSKHTKLLIVCLACIAVLISAVTIYLVGNADDGSLTTETAPDYAVEVNLTEEGDYVPGTKLALVYTNTDVTFNYDGIPMFDVSGAGYEYQGKTAFRKVYALVVDALAENTLEAYEAKITTDTDSATIIDYSKVNDVDCNNEINQLDIDSVFSVASKTELVFKEEMSVVIKADTNKDKVVNADDATSVIAEVYGKSTAQS